MAILGTKKFWIPARGASATQKENQILKNSGYINIQLHSVNYMSKGNFWQNTFGGKDNIALATNLEYQTGVIPIAATAVQDVREVRANANYNLGLQRNIAVKIPANADAISLNVRMTAVKNDVLQAKFDMLNKPEYQSALQLAPGIVGQIFSITSLVKKLFTDADPHAQLEASFAGIISSQPEDNPVHTDKLTKGFLIMISTNDGGQFNDVDESKFEVRGDTLYYNDDQVENTYIVFNISFEALKGEDEKSNWFAKYNDALNNLDKILTVEEGEFAKIYNDSKTMWIEGNALLSADVTYINSERVKIKALAIKSIMDKYKELAPPQTPAALVLAMPPTDILKGLAGSTSFRTLQAALPKTGKFLNDNFQVESFKPIDFATNGKDFLADETTLELINHDANQYLDELQHQNLSFSIGKIG